MTSAKTILLTLSLMLLLCFAFCQGRFPKTTIKEDAPITGYIINGKGDTVRCDFKKPAFGALRYKPANSTEKFKKPSTDEVKEYYSTYDSSTYVALYIDTSSTDLEYLKRLEKGTLCLYREDVTVQSFNMGMASSSTNTFYYVSKDNGLLKEIKANTLIIGGESRKKRKAYLLSLMADDATLAKQFEDEKDYDVKTLRRYIHAYNDFKASKAQ